MADHLFPEWRKLYPVKNGGDAIFPRITDPIKKWLLPISCWIIFIIPGGRREMACLCDIS